jgi:hypothetical protein
MVISKGDMVTKEDGCGCQIVPKSSFVCCCDGSVRTDASKWFRLKVRKGYRGITMFCLEFGENFNRKVKIYG